MLLDGIALLQKKKIQEKNTFEDDCYYSLKNWVLDYVLLERLAKTKKQERKIMFQCCPLTLI